MNKQPVSGAGIEEGADNDNGGNGVEGGKDMRPAPPAETGPASGMTGEDPGPEPDRTDDDGLPVDNPSG